MNEAYRGWSSEAMANWIISIDPTFESKYGDSLLTMLKQNNITGQNIDELDREDLKSYGIINLDDRKRIYSEIQKLIVHKKRRDSLQLQNKINYTGTYNISFHFLSFYFILFYFSLFTIYDITYSRHYGY